MNNLVDSATNIHAGGYDWGYMLRGMLCHNPSQRPTAHVVLNYVAEQEATL